MTITYPEWVHGDGSVERHYYHTLLRLSYAALNPGELKRFKKKYGTLAIALEEVVKKLD